MVDGMLKIIDRLIDLLDRRNKSKRLVFIEHLDPIFIDLTLIHADYLSSLRAFSELIHDPASTGPILKAELVRRQEALAPLRSKVDAMSKAILSTDLDQPIKNFARAAERYFQLTTKKRTTGYSTLLGLLDWRAWDRPLSEERVFRHIEDVRGDIADRWSELTSAYAKVRLHLLLP